MTKLFAAIFFLLSFNLAVAKDLVIKYDMGGSVEDRFTEIGKLNASSVVVKIKGTCVSACTLYLGAKDVCVYPNAKLGFHGPTTSLPGIPLPRKDFDRIPEGMASQYPPALRSWFLKKGRWITGNYFMLSGKQVIALGAKECK